MGFRIVNHDTDPAIRGCSYCDLEHGGISDDVARSFATARRAFWRAHDMLEKARAEQDAAMVHAMVRGTRDDQRAVHADDHEDENDDYEDEREHVTAPSRPRRPSSLPPRPRSGPGSSSRRVRFRRA